MVVNTHCFSATTAWCTLSIRRRHSCSSICVHIILMQKVYQNILVLIIGFCLLQLIFGGKLFISVALAVLFASAASQKAATYINHYWLWFGQKAGSINAAILLFLIYYLLLTPIAFLARIGKKDPLKLRQPTASNFQFKQHRYAPNDLKNPW